MLAEFHHGSVVAPLLHVEFPSVVELDRALVHTMRPFGLFLQGHDGIGVGEHVNVRIAVDGLEPVMLPGRVVWRRVSSGRGNPPGIGVQLDPAAAHELGGLRRTAVEQVQDGRSEIRRAVRLPVVFVSEGDGSLCSGILADVSDGGARLQTFHPPQHGTVIVLRARYGGRSPAIAARVAWRKASEAGLKIVAQSHEARAAWRSLVARRRALARGESG